MTAEPYVKPRLLDLFCGAGGSATGFHDAGFEVVGVDIVPQPNFPFEFHQDDAMALLADPYGPLGDFDAVHASPPCQDHSVLGHPARGTGWILDATIERLEGLAVPWVVENVVGPTVTMGGWWFVLCGSMFGLQVRRHRRFRSNLLMMPPVCRHGEQGRPYTITGHAGGGEHITHHRAASAAEGPVLMGMPWATWTECTQAVPPAYTEWIGGQLLQGLEVISDLDPEVLDHLAHLARLRRHRWPSRLADPEATAEALADMYTMGMKPALGWWRAQLTPRAPSGAPVCPPRALEAPITYTDVIMAAEELAGVSARPAVALELLAEMVIVADLTADVLQTAFGLYEELCHGIGPGRAEHHPSRGPRPAAPA